MSGDNDEAQRPASQEEVLARKAAELVKAARPRFKRLLAFTQPRAQLAASEAARYVREHEPELKSAAAKLARSRLRGPLGFLADSLTGSASAERQQPASRCPACETENPASAKFCNECGLRLTGETPQP